VMWFVGLSPFCPARSSFLARSAYRVGYFSSTTWSSRSGGGNTGRALELHGLDNASTIAGEVEEPQRTYPKVMITAALITWLLTFCRLPPSGLPELRGAILHWRMGGRSAEPGRLSFGARSYPGRRAR